MSAHGLPLSRRAEVPAMRRLFRLVSTRPAPSRELRPSDGPAACLVAAIDDIPELDGERHLAVLARALETGARVLTYYGRPDGDDVVLTAVLMRSSGLAVVRGRIVRDRPHPRLGGPLLVHERLLERALDLRLVPREPPRRDLAGEEAVDPRDMYFWPAAKGPLDDGPVGPGRVVARGPFRLRCAGDVVQSLEPSRRAGRRGVESLLCARPAGQLPTLVETLCGDGSVAHAWAHAAAIEGLAGITPALVTDAHRGVGLELERIANHLAGFSALTRAIGFRAGADAHDQLRATILDLTMRICGSRHGRRHVRPGGAGQAIDAARVADIRATLTGFAPTFTECSVSTLMARTVQDRLDGIGVVPRAQAAALGLVGPQGRASGCAHDLRQDLPRQLYHLHPITSVVEPDGDCLARMSVRAREIDASVAWILLVLAHEGPLRPTPVDVETLAPRHLAIAAVEGGRGPVLHAIETDAAGRILHYRAQDPSHLAWPGLALAVRHGALAEFSVCCESFDLSCSGSEL